MSNFLPHLYEFLRTRAGFAEHTAGSDIVPVRTKEYPRMQRFPLAGDAPAISLGDAILKRASAKHFGGKSINLTELSALLRYGLGMRDKERRTYPAGGSLYATEAYVVAYDVTGLPRGIFHYHPEMNVLELLWDIPADLAPERLALKTEGATAQLIITAVWRRKTISYDDFGFVLTLMEAGHIGENALLMATGLGLEARPLCGFRGSYIAQLLDIDPNEEQPIYLIALGKS